MGAIVAVIGLELAPTAAVRAGLTAASPDMTVIGIAAITFAIAVLAPFLFRGFLASLPVLVAIITGYILSVVAGIAPVFLTLCDHWIFNQ